MRAGRLQDGLDHFTQLIHKSHQTVQNQRSYLKEFLHIAQQFLANSIGDHDAVSANLELPRMCGPVQVVARDPTAAASSALLDDEIWTKMEAQAVAAFNSTTKKKLVSAPARPQDCSCVCAVGGIID